MNWFWAFVFTQAVEMPIYILGARTRWDEAFTASALTHPVVWFVFPRVFGALFGTFGAHRPDERIEYFIMVAAAEAFAVGVEAGYLASLKRKHPVRWSLIANGASFSLGLLSRWLFGAP